MNNEEEYEISTEEENSLQPEWANPPRVSDLRGDYTEAKSEHDTHVKEVSHWLDLKNITGSVKFTSTTGGSSVQPKLVQKQAEWSYASLSEPFMTTHDLFTLRPLTAGDKERAEQNSLILNNQFNTKIDKTAFIDELVRTDVDEGTVFIYTGWKYEVEEYEEEVPIFSLAPVETEEEMQELQQLAQAYQQDPETFKINSDDLTTQVIEASLQRQMPLKAVVTGTEVVVKEKILANHPAPEILDYRSVIPDPTCEGNLEEASFIIRVFETSLSELKKSGKYENLDKIQPNSGKSVEDYDDQEPSFTFKDKPRQRMDAVEYWGYWDIHGTGEVVSIVATWIGNTMIRLEENPSPDGKLPFVSCQLMPVRKSNFGQPNAHLIGDNQAIQGATIRGMVDLLGKSANAQVGRAKDALDPRNKARFERGDSYEYNPTSDPSKAFYMHKFPEIPQSALLMNQVMVSDAQELTGVRPFAQSQSGTVGSETAAGVRSADDATTKRESGVLRRLANCLTRMARKYIAMNAEFLTEAEVVRITNDQFVEVRVDDLAGDYDVVVEISTAEADNAKAQELAFMMQTTAQSMGPEFTKIILADIAKLRKMPELAQKIEEYEPQPDPMEQEIKMLTIEKLKAEISEINTRAMENQASAILDQAKAGTEQAKAGNLQSDTDLKDLSFVEQEKGVTQERAKELQSQQAKANMGLKAFDHVLQGAKDSDTTTSNGSEQV